MKKVISKELSYKSIFISSKNNNKTTNYFLVKIIGARNF